MRKALRLDPESADHAKIESRVAYLEGKALADRGTPDPFILRRALELDPKNVAARDLLATFEEHAVTRKTRGKRYAAAIAVGLLAVIAMVWLARRREPPAPRAAAHPPEDKPRDESAGEEPTPPSPGAPTPPLSSS